MIKSLVLASYNYVGGEVGDMLRSWEELGLYTYLLPFLLVFALVFGLLSKTKIFKDNKAINAIIAFVVGLMSLQFELVPRFFAEIFPRMGVGLGIILVVLIFLGIFLPKQSWVTFTLMGIAAVVVIVVLVKSAGAVGWSGGYWWAENWKMIAGAIFLLVIISVIVGGSSEKKGGFIESPVMKALFGDEG